MASHNHLVMAMLLISSSAFAAEENDAQSLTTFYDVLRSNGLPIGVFPKGISNLSIDEASGGFRLRLRSRAPCDAVFETRLRYDQDVTGRISYGKISNVTGVSAQELFLWLAVKGIEVDIPSSGLIYFDVEVVSKQLSLSFFESPKDCHFAGDVDVGEGEGAKNDDDRVPVPESPASEKFLRKRIMDHEKRAVSL